MKNICFCIILGLFISVSSPAAIFCDHNRGTCHGQCQGSAPANLRNRFLTLAELNSIGFPPTDLSVWQMVASCDENLDPSLWCPGINAPNLPNVACADGTLQPGIYLFVSNFFGVHFCQAKIAIFDRPVGFRIIHMTNTYSIFLDVNNQTFISWTDALNAGHPCNSCDLWPRQETNVSSLDSAPPRMSIYRIQS